MEEIKTINDSVKDNVSLLSRYDESTAKEIDDLKCQSEALEAQKAQLLIEIDKAKQQLALADKKSRLNEIYSEHERIEGLITELTIALPKMKAKAESYKFDFDVSTLQEQYQKIVMEIHEAATKKDALNRQTLLLNEEIKALKDTIKETLATIGVVEKELHELNLKTDSLKTRMEGLERLKSSLSKKTESLQNPYKQDIEALQSDINSLSELCGKLISEYSDLSSYVKGLFNAIKDKSQLSIETNGNLKEIEQTKAHIQKLQEGIHEKSALIQEIVSQTTSDKEKSLALETELEGILKEIQHFTQEIAKIKELTKTKDEAEERFKRLLVENYSFCEGLRSVNKHYRKIKDIVRKMQ